MSIIRKPAQEVTEAHMIVQEPQLDKTTAKLKEQLRDAQTARKDAERQVDELRSQLQTATLEIMRLKVEVYDLTHGIA